MNFVPWAAEVVHRLHRDYDQLVDNTRGCFYAISGLQTARIFPFGKVGAVISLR